MTRKAYRSILLIAGLSAAAAAYGIYYCYVLHFNAVAYDRIIESYFHNDSYYVDVWALWKELGVNPGSLRESRSSDLRTLLNQGRYIFYAESDKVML